MPHQKRKIYEEIALKVHYEDTHSLTYSYDEALIRYKFALASAQVGGAKASEKAWICLKMAWLFRAKAEELNPRLPVYEIRLEECKKDEIEALQLAIVGFSEAKESEGFPILGMDESTLDYLISALSIKLGDYETAEMLLQKIITAGGIKRQLKDRAKKMIKKVNTIMPA